MRLTAVGVVNIPALALRLVAVRQRQRWGFAGEEALPGNANGRLAGFEPVADADGVK